MSAILSADDLNDFISPGVACIKPVETLPKQQLEETSNAYEVTREDKVPASAADAPPAQISLTDCLACSGCVTSAEAVLVSLQSHEEVISTLDRHSPLELPWTKPDEGVDLAGPQREEEEEEEDGKLFIASVSPQTRASLAALYGISERDAGYMIDQLLSGPEGLKKTGLKGSSFTWVVDTNTLREVCSAGVVEEALGEASILEAQNTPRNPILASACPGWICYIEKTHPELLHHLSRLKSPQAMSGTLLKSVLGRKYGIAPDKIWHLAIMPCFDKKLEASREELTDVYWQPTATENRGVRDVDCVVTARELVMLADMTGISFPNLPRRPVPHAPFPDPVLDRYLFPRGRRRDKMQMELAGSSGGYAYSVIRAQQRRVPGSEIHTKRGRNTDVFNYILTKNDVVMARTARFYGFGNIQNLVRKLKPAKKSRMPAAASRRAVGSNAGASTGANTMPEYTYIEVMACPGGCTNGGGQIKASDVADLKKDTVLEENRKIGPAEQKEWLRRVDEAYYSGGESEDEGSSSSRVDGVDVDGNLESQIEGSRQNAEDEDEDRVQKLLQHWTSSTGVSLNKLLFTAYRQVESDVGKVQGKSDTERVAGLASSIGGGW